MICYVCQRDTTAVYTSPGASITTLCKTHPSPTQVFFCSHCEHVQTQEIPDIDVYYADEYNILSQSEEEDQIYAVEGERKIFRFDHQAAVLQQKIELETKRKVLDYGCAKSSTWRIAKRNHDHLDLHLFDVSNNYVHFWSNLVTDSEKWATFELPLNWGQRFDLVTSFYAFEHISSLELAMKNVFRVLKEEGLLYILVPNFLINRADFIVADHVNHFTESSLRYLFNTTGFEVVELDTVSHYGGIIVVGRRLAQPAASPPDLLLKPNLELREQITLIAEYWNTLKNKLLLFEQNHRSKAAVIYGSGFYGSYIANSLQHLDQVLCFLDQNPYRQTDKLLGKSILSPTAIPNEVEIVYVGLNPEIARQAIESMPLWKEKKVEVCYL